MSKIIWYLKQLLPLKYVSKYREDDENKLTVWNMWFGKCYNITNYDLK